MAATCSSTVMVTFITHFYGQQTLWSGEAKCTDGQLKCTHSRLFGFDVEAMMAQSRWWGDKSKVKIEKEEILDQRRRNNDEDGN